jgi:glycosyltransferase involved in cell wall biosynthesis
MEGSAQATLVAIAKNEERYMTEWIAFHLAVGFDRIVIYDNESEDGTSEIVRRIAKRDKRVTALSWSSGTVTSPQISAYENALGMIETPWLMFMDIDEFIVPFGFRDFRSYLQTIPSDVSSVHINWRGFGSSNRHDSGYDLVTRAFNRCSDRAWENNHHFKSLGRTNLVESVHVHDIQTRAGRRVLSNFQEFETFNRGISDRVVHEGIQINHYQCKTFTEFQARMRRGNAFFHPSHPEWHRDDSFARFTVLDRNECEDVSIRQFDADVDSAITRIKVAPTTHSWLRLRRG